MNGQHLEPQLAENAGAGRYGNVRALERGRAHIPSVLFLLPFFC